MRLYIPSTLLALLAWPGCVPAPAFYCQDNRACVSSDGAQGLCELNGTCAFPDPSCAGSRRRYGSGSSVGDCVAAEDQCIASLSLGSSHACALRTDGQVFCWGANGRGQVGAPAGVPQLVAPTRFALPAKATAISVGETHACALLEDGRVMCWGGNDLGDLGNDNAPVASVVPVEVRGPSGAPYRAQAIAAGGAHTCAIGADGGAVSCWGENWPGGGVAGGQCGQDPHAADGGLAATVPHATPIVTTSGALDFATGLGSGQQFTCGLGTGSRVYCFGSNHAGSLGTQAVDLYSFTPVAVADLLDVAALAVGAQHACVTGRDGTLWCWGSGASGSLGTGSTSNSPLATRVGTAARVFSGSASTVTCSLDDAAFDLECWGANDSGQTGTGSAAPVVSRPTRALLTAVNQVALGQTFGCATTLGGGLWCWGKNDLGQLGLGAVGAPVMTPQRVDFPCR